MLGMTDYIDMFGLTKDELERRILDCSTPVNAFADEMRAKGRSVVVTPPEKLPNLGLANEAFDLALMSHYLFTRSDELSLDFHVTAIQELLRVANEVRIFPLVKGDGELSPYVGEVVARLQILGFGVELRGMKQKEGGAMMRVWAASCTVT